MFSICSVVSNSSLISSNLTLVADFGLDVRDDDVHSLNRHLVQLEVVRREAIVGNDNVRILLRRLDVLFEGRLCLVLVSLQELCQRYLLVLIAQGILKDASRQSDIVISVNEQGQVKHLAQFFVTEDKSTFNDDDIARLHIALRLKSHLVELIVYREVERLPLAQLLDTSLLIGQ